MVLNELYSSCLHLGISTAIVVHRSAVEIVCSSFRWLKNRYRILFPEYIADSQKVSSSGCLAAPVKEKVNLSYFFMMEIKFECRSFTFKVVFIALNGYERNFCLKRDKICVIFFRQLIS